MSINHTQTPRAARWSLHALLATLFALGVALSASTAAAQDAANTSISVLKVEVVSGFPDSAQADLEKVIVDAINADERRLKAISPGETRDKLMKLSPAVAGCLTDDCLKRAGQLLKAPLATMATVSGEAQIYDFVFTIYDLNTGRPQVEHSSSCEICTAAEAQSAFAKGFATALAKATIPEPKPAAPPKPVETPKPAGPTTRVDIVVLPAEATIEIGDLPIGAGTATRKLAPGTYTIRVSAQGHDPLETKLVVDKKAKGPIMLRLQLSKSAPAVADANAEAPVMTSQDSGGGVHQPALGWSLAVVGVGAAATGAYLLAIDGDTTCSEGTVNQCPEVFETTAGGATLLGIGTATAAAGVVFIVLDMITPEGTPVLSQPDPNEAGTSIFIDPVDNTAGIRVTW